MRLGCFRYRSQGGQGGYIMIALVLAVALILIALSAGLPVLSAELRRQREEELIHRGVQYTRAIRNYYRAFHTYPTTLDQLEDSNHIRFLRKRYKDPMTGEDFRVLHMGEVTLSFRVRGGTSGQDGDNSTGANSDINQERDGGQLSPSSSSQTTSDMPANGPNFEGGPIIGVASSSQKKSFHVFDDKDHYDEWKFVYNPALDTGGLFTRPYDGIWAFNTTNPPNNFALPPPVPLQSGAPGMAIPGVTQSNESGHNAGR
jgi:type II secretory pathway pseudopilin PulG